MRRPALSDLQPRSSCLCIIGQLFTVDQQANTITTGRNLDKFIHHHSHFYAIIMHGRPLDGPPKLFMRGERRAYGSFFLPIPPADGHRLIDILIELTI